MDIEDILYFLFLAGWLVLGALRKKNKQKDIQKTPVRESVEVVEEKPYKSFQELITELSHQAELSRQKVYESTIQTDIEDDNQEFEPEKSNQPIKEEGRSAFSNFDKSALLIIEEERGANSSLLNDFDLKKAIIYETILNRKYT